MASHAGVLVFKPVGEKPPPLTRKRELAPL